MITPAEKIAAAIREMEDGATSIDILGGNCCIGDEGAKELAMVLKTNGTLRTLFLQGNSIGNEGAKDLAAAFRSNGSLTNLRLGGNRIGVEGAKELATALKTNASLQTLYLGGNWRIGDKGAKELAAALKTNGSLQKLDLQSDGIGPEGAKGLAAGLKTNGSLTFLNLSRNSIGDEGAKELAAALKTNMTLQTLYLGSSIFSNGIGDEGAKVLAAALKTNGSLTYLDLSSNSIGDEGAEELAAALERNQSVLQTLDFGNPGAAALADALETNDLLQALGLPGRISIEIKERIGGRLKLAEDEVNALSASALEALKTDEKVRWGRAKLMVVGKGAAGKTSTIRTLLGQPVVFEHESTIGADLKLMHTRDWKERPHMGNADLGEQFAKYKYRRPSTTKRLSQDLSRVRRSASRASSQPREAAPRPPKRLSLRLSRRFASRASQPREAAPRPPKRLSQRLSRARRFASRASQPRPLSMRFDEAEVSRAVKTPLRVRVKEQGGKLDEEVSFTIWDYGGQEVFYALHHLFLTQYGVYALVFDMREVLGKERLEGELEREELVHLASQEEALETLRFWIDSIRLHAPGVAVALVGTYLDQVPDVAQHEEIQDILKASLLKGLGGEVKIQRNKLGRRVLQFFPIDNVDRDDAEGRVANLREVLTKAVLDRPFVKEKVPLRWSYCLDLLLRADRPYMALVEVATLAQERCYITAQNVSKMLDYMHELGVLVHLTSNDTLRKVVVLRPQWLLDNLSRVICEPDTKHMERHKERLLRAEGREELPHELEDALDEWADRGVASRGLLEWLWQDEPLGYLTTLMESMLLASPSPWIRGADDKSADKEGALLVPSLLRAAMGAERVEALNQLNPDALAYVECKFLPRGVFQRFVAMVVKSFAGLATVRPEIFSNLASVDFDGVACVMEASSKRVTLRFGARKHGGRLPPLLTLLRRSLDEIDRSFMRSRLTPKLYVSADGTDNDAACVLLKELASLEGGGRVRARDKKARLPLEAFAAFVQDAAQAQELQDSMASTETPSYDVFLSHAWGPGKTTHAKVVAVAEGLQELEISCWLDAKDVGADVFASMADGIDRSRASVIFVTREYMDKVNKELAEDDNCRLEFHYAMNRQKFARVIPCVLDPTMTDTSDWKGRFGIRWNGNPLYVPMLSDGGPTDEELAELAQRIREVIDQD